ncbi:MAG: hypoxanthine phosphoribosyltransferase [Saccharofermentans sp.]|nr:hypoxanthine phosphoribosyltransferase [Saccharofermentans sp.]
MAIDTSRVLVTHEQIEEMLERLSAQLNKDYADRHLVVVGILTGAFIFTSDLIRRLTMPVTVDFMQVSSYVGEVSSGVLKIKKDLSYDIEGKDVLIVEDIVDTGRTLALLMEQLQKRNPASLKVCTAFDKPARRVNTFVPDYNGLTVPDEFIVGYGLDLDGEYRNFDDIRIVRKV